MSDTNTTPHRIPDQPWSDDPDRWPPFPAGDSRKTPPGWQARVLPDGTIQLHILPWRTAPSRLISLLAGDVFLRLHATPEQAAWLSCACETVDPAIVLVLLDSGVDPAVWRVRIGDHVDVVPFVEGEAVTSLQALAAVLVRVAATRWALRNAEGGA